MDDVVSLQSQKRVSGQVTVGIGVTGMIISPTGSRNFNGDLTLGIPSRSFFS